MIVDNYFNVFTCEQHQLEYSSKTYTWVTWDEDGKCIRNMRGDRHVERMFHEEHNAYIDKEALTRHY